MNIASYPQEDCLKESGVTWIGRIPAHWEIKRLRHLTRKIGSGITPTGGALTYVDDGIPLLRSQNVLFGKIELEGAARIAERVHKRMSNSQVQKGDVLLNITGGSIGRCHFVDRDEDLNVNQHVCIIRPTDGIVSQYLNFLLSSEVGQKQIWFWQQGGGREGLNFEAIKDFAFAVPPLHEQRAIAAFLDGKCATVDGAVRIKEAQIALLRERRQILIQQAVTRGLNPDAPMKDSGIDWIGQIPAHWAVRRGKHLFREVNERSADGSEELLSVSHTSGVTSRSEKNVTMFLAEDYSGSKLCQPGDVVINTMWAWMGALGVSDLAGIVSPSYGVYRPLHEGSFNRRFLEWLLRTTLFIEQYNKISTGLHSSRLRLYPHMFLGLPMATPSRGEQDALVAHVESEAGKIDKAISIKKDQITALKEYKSSLINAAVTGKIRVT